MRLCLHCDKRFSVDDYLCPACGNSPMLHDGHPVYAPELDANFNGYSTDFFSSLAEIEAGYFWCEARNHILVGTLRKYFPTAESLLEIGCGTGFALLRLRQEFPGIKLSGSDIFNEGLAYAKKRVRAAQFFQMDARKIPFEDELDVIGAFDVLEHIEEDELVLSQVFRAVRCGGIIFTVPQHQWLWSRNDAIAGHKRRYSRKELVAKVHKAGFQVIFLTSFVSFLFPLMLLSRFRGRRDKGSQEDIIKELQQPDLLNKMLGRVCDFERWFIKMGVAFPMGGSLLCVAAKR